MATVLLIDAEKEFADPMATALRSSGYDCVLVGDGKEGLDKATSLKPAAIILCVELPRMSGYSICNKLKKDDALKSIPLIITSREATHETFEQHKKLKTRAEAYLIKPFTFDELRGVLGTYIPGAKPATAAQSITSELKSELKPLDLMESGPEEDIVLDDIPIGTDETIADSKSADPFDELGLNFDEDEDRAPTRIMKMPSPEELAKFRESAKTAAPPKPVAATAASPTATQVSAAVTKPRPTPVASESSPSQSAPATKPAPAMTAAAARPVSNDERAQLEQKLQEARTKASQSAQEVDKLRAEMNQLRTKSREETAALRKQLQELTERQKTDQQVAKQRHEESLQKAIVESQQLRQQVKDVQLRAQGEMEQLRAQLIEVRNQSQDLLTQREGEVSANQTKIQELATQLQALRAEQSRSQKVRERTQKAVDVALQLLQDEGASSSEDAA